MRDYVTLLTGTNNSVVTDSDTDVMSSPFSVLSSPEEKSRRMVKAPRQRVCGSLRYEIPRSPPAKVLDDEAEEVSGEEEEEGEEVYSEGEEEEEEEEEEEVSGEEEGEEDDEDQDKYDSSFIDDASLM